MKKDDVYSPFKVAHHKDKLEQLKKGEIITPVFVQWDLTNICNLLCNFCFYLTNKLSDWNPIDTMPTETVFRILGELKSLDVKAIEWTGGGSIECHPDYKDILKEAKRLGFQQALVSNGTLLDEEALHIIGDFEWVRFSIDSVTSGTYKKIKGKDLFQKAIDNLKRLLEIKSHNNVVGYSFVVCRENYTEILEATKFAKELGCDNIRFSLAMTPSGDKLFDGIWKECTNQLKEAKQEECNSFRVFSFSNRIFELAGQVFSDSCYYTDFVGVIAPRGMYPCCRLKDNKNFNFGNLEEKSFKEIWFGEKRKKFLNAVRNGCPYSCWMTDKNKFISYLLEENPRHVNFP